MAPFIEIDKSQDNGAEPDSKAQSAQNNQDANVQDGISKQELEKEISKFPMPSGHSQ